MWHIEKFTIIYKSKFHWFLNYSVWQFVNIARLQYKSNKIIIYLQVWSFKGLLLILLNFISIVWEYCMTHKKAIKKPLNTQTFPSLEKKWAHSLRLGDTCYCELVLKTGAIKYQKTSASCNYYLFSSTFSLKIRLLLLKVVLSFLNDLNYCRVCREYGGDFCNVPRKTREATHLDVVALLS